MLIPLPYLNYTFGEYKNAKEIAKALILNIELEN